MSLTIQDALTNFECMINRLSPIANLALIAVIDKSKHFSFFARYTVAEGIFVNFQTILDTVSFKDAEPVQLENYHSAVSQIDELWGSIKGVYLELTKASVVKQNDSTIAFCTSNSANHLNYKLPKMELKTFNGDIKTWTMFINVFNTSIHEKTCFSNVEKFQYLLSVLRDEPLALVRTLPLTDANYLIAYDTLYSRYQNDRHIATCYWNEIQSFPAITHDNPKSLRKLLDVFSENLSALELLNFPVKEWDFILFNLMLQKLDTNCRRRFEVQQDQHVIPSYNDLKNFVDNTCRALETSASFGDLNRTVPVAKPPVNNWKSKSRQNTSLCVNFARNLSITKCPLCSSDHSLSKCDQFLIKGPKERYSIAKQLNVCLNCLGSHLLKNCSSKSSCRTCTSTTHHTLLHFPRDTSVSSPRQGTETPLASSSPSSSAVTADYVRPLQNTLNVSCPETTVLLGTAIVEIMDREGRFHSVKAVLDCGSQLSIISENCMQKLGLTRRRCVIPVAGAGSTVHTFDRGMTSCVIKPLDQPSPLFSLDAVITSKPCNPLPSMSFDCRAWPHLANLRLADKKFFKKEEIDLLIGAEIFSDILLPMPEGHEKLPQEPKLLNTIFGFVVIGKINLPVNKCQQYSSLNISLDHSLDYILKQFWQVEDVPNKTHISPEEEVAENLFTSLYSRLDSRRFVVPLLLKTNKPLFPGSYDVAKRRFLSVERRLAKDQVLRSEYHAFMSEYITLGHMELLSLKNFDSRCYYIPHHCVLRPESSSTKLRVVFDAGAACYDNTSLNDKVLPGPKLQADICDLLLRFRLHKVVLIADLKKMFRQILILPADLPYQRILWRFSPEEPIQTYQLKTVTYGVASSPYLANRVVKQLAKDEAERFPLASSVVLKDVFVDDIVTSISSDDKADSLIEELINMFALGGFELHKWVTNSFSLIKRHPGLFDKEELLSFDSEPSPISKVLGLSWQSFDDYFTYLTQPIDRPCSKRTILSETARMFDPLGFLAPLTFFAKHLMQRLWSLGLDWDEQPPDEIIQLWKNYKKELSLLSTLKIPRLLTQTGAISCELHGFADSSELGYGAVIYFRFIDQAGTISVFFVFAKTKVAPLKRLSIPRLKLCACVLLSKLIHYIISTFLGYLSFNKVFAWSDSSVALSWIRSPAHRWKPFIANRVSFIQDIVAPVDWHHVASSDNPADCASRGLLPKRLIDYSIWWQGPEWLSQPGPYPKEIVVQNSAHSKFVNQEQRAVLLVQGETPSIPLRLLDEFSSFHKIRRILGYILRFIHNYIRPAKVKGPLSIKELQNATLILVRATQAASFSAEIKLIKQNKLLPKPLRRLSPFIDEAGILRVGGRLRHSSLTFDAKHPMLLPRNCRLTELIIEQFHKDYLHPGSYTLSFLVLQQFWILGARRVIRSVVSRCNRCFRVMPVAPTPRMSDLPVYRISHLKPFSHVGVDFAGPFSITLSRFRGSKSSKGYICLFICCAVKAIHLELVSSLSAEAFLAAFRRFVGRRGRVSDIYSDQGTNFIGAYRILQNLAESTCRTLNITWHYNPPSSPHFGGLWERGVRSVKSHLYRVVGKQLYNFEEFSTILVQIEALLNSRPLCSSSTDPNDLSTLTPGHFLTLEPLSAPPDENLGNLKLNRLSRWQLIQKCQQDFWRRWHLEYLSSLQVRTKWDCEAPSIKIGDLVLIKQANTPPLDWPLGRVLNLHPGADGVVRVATIKTISGELQRPLVKLCRLPSQ